MRGLHSAGDPDCILEDLERPGVFPAPPLSPGLRRSASLSSQLVSQCVRSPGGPGVPGVACDVLTAPGTPSFSASTAPPADCEAGLRLPGTFHCLQEVQDTGLTPSPLPGTPRALTPLVLLPLQESQSAREKLQSSLKRKLKTSLGVRLGGSY